MLFGHHQVDIPEFRMRMQYFEVFFDGLLIMTDGRTGQRLGRAVIAKAKGRFFDQGLE